MKLVLRPLLAVWILLASSTAQHKDSTSGKGKEIAASNAGHFTQKGKLPDNRLRGKRGSYKRSKVATMRSKLNPGGYVPRQHLSSNLRQIEDEKFVQFLQANQAHHEVLQTPESHAEEAFDIREKAPAHEYLSAYPKQLRRYFKTYHHANRAFLNAFSRKYRQLYKHDRYAANKDLSKGQGGRRYLPRHPSRQVRVSATAQNWGIKKRRTGLPPVVGGLSKMTQYERDAGGSSQNKGMEWDLNLDEAENVSRYGQGAWTNPLPRREKNDGK